jgi:DNA-binding GntR family transcriptional regulator
MLDPYLHTWEEGGLADHMRILEALRAHDPEAARQAMAAHIQAGLQRILLKF